MRAFYPSRLCVLIALSPCLLSLALIYDMRLLNGILILDACIVGLILFDLLISRLDKKALQIDISCAGTWSLGRNEDVLLLCEYLGVGQRHLHIRLDTPRSIVTEPQITECSINPHEMLQIQIEAEAQERGRFEIRGVHCSVRSRLGLWNLHYQRGNSTSIFVYPNIKQLHDYALLARTNRLALIGVRKMRAVGGDTEFERLRDYHSDDPIQRIDWKASARRDELTVRDFQPNQSQSIMLMIDAGRMMVTRDQSADGVAPSMLDHAINASLLLAYVAIKQGDRVGLIAYADGVKRYIPAAGGEKQIHKLIHAVHDLHASLVESRHEEAFLYLQRMERKRSLVVMFTHILDDVNAMHVEQHCRKLVGRHLPMAVLLRDQALHRHLAHAPRNSQAFWRSAAAAHICNWRQELIDRLRVHGCLVLDCDPDELNAGVISRYLELKAKHLL